jgi:hypothetical protein
MRVHAADCGANRAAVVQVFPVNARLKVRGGVPILNDISGLECPRALIGEASG